MKKESFRFIFQITKSIIMEVSYYKLGNNIDKYFTISTTDINNNVDNDMTNEVLLKDFYLPYAFYNVFNNSILVI